MVSGREVLKSKRNGSLNLMRQKVSVFFFNVAHAVDAAFANQQNREPIHEVAARISATGIIVCELKIPMLAEASPATPICRKPSMADALPMLRSNGTSASAGVWICAFFVRNLHPTCNPEDFFWIFWDD